MTIGEFKAWLDGFSEGKRGRMTEKQLARVIKKLGEVQEDHSGCTCHHCYPWTIRYDWTIPCGDTVTNPAPYEGTTITSPNITWESVSSTLFLGNEMQIS